MPRCDATPVDLISRMIGVTFQLDAAKVRPPAKSAEHRLHGARNRVCREALHNPCRIARPICLAAMAAATMTARISTIFWLNGLSAPAQQRRVDRVVVRD